MQTFQGTIISAKTPKTVGVAINYSYKHPKYGKIIKRTTKLLAHNEMREIKEGDVVRVIKSRPYSKNKHFLVTEVLGEKVVENKTPEPKITLPEKKESVKSVRKSGQTKKR
ncbi:MAG: 30S ribosomal protein S17 [Microgenomates group bacterium GW2011_GWA1_48_10]|uniref:Small ribosomal subunit protein uS17 n=1 Tax=Candidatus Gottesmanbacteria bacterium RIFCSPHIGHO2_01_FULL_47_48 TaxID=1798381 RepID=A0A1F6A2Z9_9BACT|nr:MAG: 30S ribosomal protein S17 [Microgenomates group bacterium GW2011_GWA1_48_10]OGG18872.1 MAG: 30S ribosomal protein S17 [Candidatus Gottesmanbacteria bacterium RIFCSPHIGHO2_01_FULL_47_48]